MALEVEIPQSSNHSAVAARFLNRGSQAPGKLGVVALAVLPTSTVEANPDRRVGLVGALSTSATGASTVNGSHKWLTGSMCGAGLGRRI